jgi:hypothetical protein
MKIIWTRVPCHCNGSMQSEPSGEIVQAWGGEARLLAGPQQAAGGPLAVVPQRPALASPARPPLTDSTMPTKPIQLD